MGRRFPLLYIRTPDRPPTRLVVFYNRLFQGIPWNCQGIYSEFQGGNFRVCLGIPGYIFGILYLLYTLFGMKSRRDNIGHTSHFGGAVAGFVFTLFIYPTLINTQMNLILLMMAPLLLYLLMKRRGYL